jgi:tetratricopeptide (TPR) repeat protein
MALEADSTLFCARQCIEKGARTKGSEGTLAVAHEQIATVLNDRGVYTEALNHAKEAAALNADNSFAYDDVAVALIGLRRFSEAVNQETQGIRLSDGKYSWMHFHLGNAYFEQENWQFALQSLRKLPNSRQRTQLWHPMRLSVTKGSAITSTLRIGLKNTCVVNRMRRTGLMF